MKKETASEAMRRETFFFSRYTSTAYSKPRAHLALASTYVKKTGFPHLPLPHYFSNGLLFRGVSQKSANKTPALQAGAQTICLTQVN